MQDWLRSRLGRAGRFATALAVASLLVVGACAGPTASAVSGPIDCATAARDRNALAGEQADILRREVAGATRPDDGERYRLVGQRRRLLLLCR